MSNLYKEYCVVGKYITVDSVSKWFLQTASMILEHYDTPEYENTVFVLGGHVTHQWEMYEERHPGKKFIFYQQEQLFRNPDQVNEHWWDIDIVLKRIRRAMERGAVLWDMDFMNIDFLEREGITVDRFAPLKFAKALEDLPPNDNPDIDVLFFGALNNKRCNFLSPLLNSLYHEDIMALLLVGGDEERLKEYIGRAKIVINIHHTGPWNRQEQPRISYLLNNKKCVLSEPSQHNYYGPGIVEAEYGNFAERIKYLLKDDNYKKQGELGYNLFKKK